MQRGLLAGDSPLRLAGPESGDHSGGALAVAEKNQPAVSRGLTRVGWLRRELKHRTGTRHFPEEPADPGPAPVLPSNLGR